MSTWKLIGLFILGYLSVFGFWYLVLEFGFFSHYSGHYIKIQHFIPADDIVYILIGCFFIILFTLVILAAFYTSGGAKKTFDKVLISIIFGVGIPFAIERAISAFAFPYDLSDPVNMVITILCFIPLQIFFTTVCFVLQVTLIEENPFSYRGNLPKAINALLAGFNTFTIVTILFFLPSQIARAGGFFTNVSSLWLQLQGYGLAGYGIAIAVLLAAIVVMIFLKKYIPPTTFILSVLILPIALSVLQAAIQAKVSTNILLLSGMIGFILYGMIVMAYMARMGAYMKKVFLGMGLVAVDMVCFLISYVAILEYIGIQVMGNAIVTLFALIVFSLQSSIMGVSWFDSNVIQSDESTA